MGEALDTANYYLVSLSCDQILIQHPPLQPLTKHQALVFAAWIVTLADPLGGEFEGVLQAVQAS